MDGYTKVCKLEELREKIGSRFFVDDTDIAVFLVDGEVYSMSNVCPHQHAAIIHDGFIEGRQVVCPSHGWQFNLTDGKRRTGANGLQTYPVKIVGDDVYVKVIRKEFNW